MNCLTRLIALTIIFVMAINYGVEMGQDTSPGLGTLLGIGYFLLWSLIVQSAITFVSWLGRKAKNAIDSDTYY